jgi:ATP-dependent protease ClpP protease subunit
MSDTKPNDKIELTEEQLMELIEEATGGMVGELIKKSQFLEQVSYFDMSDSIPVWGGIDEDASLKFVNRFKQLESLSQNSDDIITVWINSPGGNVTDCSAIVDCIRSSTRPVRCIATGLCASAGLFILAAGDIRLATKQATLFYHEPIMKAGVSCPQEMEQASYFYELSRQRMVYDVLYKACEKIKRKTSFNKIFEGKVSLYISPETALNEYGLIHKIV